MGTPQRRAFLMIEPRDSSVASMQCLTGSGLELTRLTLLGHTGEVLYSCPIEGTV